MSLQLLPIKSHTIIAHKYFRWRKKEDPYFSIKHLFYFIFLLIYTHTNTFEFQLIRLNVFKLNEILTHLEIASAVFSIFSHSRFGVSRNVSQHLIPLNIQINSVQRFIYFFIITFFSYTKHKMGNCLLCVCV